MKKALFVLGISLILVGLLLAYQEDLQKIYYDILREINKDEIVLEKNEYYRPYDFRFVQNTDDFEPNSRQEILNIYYTAINSGVNDFTFYCPDSYSSCISEVEKIANDQNLLSDINNFVHPFNGFNHLETQYDSLGKVSIHVVKSYTEEQIKVIQEKVDSVKNDLIIKGDSDTNNIRRVHDYIINNSVYDTGRSDFNLETYESDIAYGPLLQGYGICGGYTDAMELFLEEMGIKSYKISSEEHIWNALYLDGSWYHLDLTWDDPVTTSGEDLLEDKFFLIDTKTLHAIEQTEHQFDTTIYQELKEA